MTKITIIEDDPTINQMYRMKFEADGFSVSMASSGKVGLKIVEKIRPDIILLDLKMPEMDGIETLKKIRKTDHGKQVPVIILTNLNEEESSDELRKLGIHSYIVKADYTPRQVVSHVKEAIEEMSD